MDKRHDPQVANLFNKGVILGPTINRDRYICPATGAHFEFRDMYRRLETVQRKREFDPSLQNIGTRQLNKDVLADQQAVQEAFKKKKQQDA